MKNDENARKTEKIKEILSYPVDERTDKMLLNLMSLTKDIPPFDNIAMKEEHMNICREMTLVHYKPNEIIVKQGDPGDSFFIILSGMAKITITKYVDIGLNGNKIMTEKYLNDLGPGDSFGEVSLIYGTRRTATIVSISNTCLVRLDKANFDIYVKDIFENQLKDQIDFMHICPIFHNVKKETLIKLAIRTKISKKKKEEVIVASKNRCEKLFLIRRGTVNVLKTLDFYKNDIQFRSNLDNENTINWLSDGPGDKTSITRDIVLETLKMGDIFPPYYSMNNIPLDVFYQAETPCEVIVININDLYDILKDVYSSIQNYSKPYPSDDFLRRIYYYNSAWNDYKNTIKYNILADLQNKKTVDKQKMRDPLVNRKDVNKVRLPNIFINKSMQIDTISKKYSKNSK